MTVSALHEALVALFRNRPELAPELMRDALHLEVPAYAEARVESADFNEAKAVELRADLVVLLVDGQPVLVIVVEVQLGRDDSKRESWPSYLVGARSRFKCNAAVLVLAPEADVAAWARRPIVLGPDNVFKPLVVGSDVVPVVRSVEQARGAPELAVLSAKAHGTDAVVGAEVGFAAAVAAAGLPAERAALYWDVVMASLNAATRVALEEMMTSGHYEYQSDFAKKYFSEGKVEGKADALLRILAARDLVVSAAERAQIVACTDLERLDGWIERAVHASTTADVLAER